jgi:hypothetical protein
MANRLPIPEDLQHLVEKRAVADRRSGQDRRLPDPDGCRDVEEDASSPRQVDAAEDSDLETDEQERRSGSERRTVTRRQEEKEG